MTIENLLNDLIADREIDLESLKQCFADFCDGVDYPPEQQAALLVLLRARGETPEQLAAIADVFMQRAVNIEMPDAAVCLCGTGGDGAGTFNISTTASLLIAASGVAVAKHGSRSVTSKSGSADVLDELGIATDLSPEKAIASLQSHNFAFLFAQLYHPAFKHIAPIRTAVKVRTLFNILGPLLHPSNLKRQVIGVFDAALLDTMANALALAGHEKTLVVHSEDGLDEISMTGRTFARLVDHGKVSKLELTPEEFGFSRCSLEDLKGGSASDNADILRSIFAGEQSSRADCVLFNAGVALWLAGTADSIGTGIEQAREVQQSGNALNYIKGLGEVH